MRPEPTSVTSLAALLEPVLAIAVAAGDVIMEVYDSDFAVSTKDDASPLTQADLRAHRTIIDGLSKLTPEIPCLIGAVFTVWSSVAYIRQGQRILRGQEV